METKQCPKCKETKLISEFPIICSKPYYYCRECKKIVEKKYRDSLKGIEHRRKYQQYYGRTPQRKAYVKKRNSRDDIRIKQNNNFKKQKLNPDYKLKMNARKKCKYWIKKGLILKNSCLICGNNNTSPHHPNYNNPLYVIWLCKDCHMNIEKILAYVKNNFFNIITEYKLPEYLNQINLINGNEVNSLRINNLTLRYLKKINVWRITNPSKTILAEIADKNKAIEYARNITDYIKRKQYHPEMLQRNN